MKDSLPYSTFALSLLFGGGLVLGPFAAIAAPDLTVPLAAEDLVLTEKDQVLAIEAEHFFKQSLTGKRAWYLTHSGAKPEVNPDGDPPHVGGASGGAYLEVLPDTRRNHGQKLIDGENFSNVPGKIGVLHYKVNITHPGRYYVWVRAWSTTSEDNGLHFGIDGEWPESGQRWQTVQKNGWNWDCRQRTEKVHTGVPMQLWLDIEKPGPHEFTVAMREDGIEVDRFVLAGDKAFRPEGIGPASIAAAGALPAPFPFVAAPKTVSPAPVDPSQPVMEAGSFPVEGTGYYLDKGKWLAIDPDTDKEARAEAPFPFASGRYDVTLQAVGEEDGKSTYGVSINDVVTGAFTCPLSAQPFEEGAAFATTWKGIAVNQGDVVAITSKIASEDGKEFSRARVARLVFAPADETTKAAVAQMVASTAAAAPLKATGPALVLPRGKDGDGKVEVTGELKEWHKVTLTVDGPYAHERDNAPNPFTDYRFDVVFTHESGSTATVPGYFAADGNAGETSAESGNKWRVHFAADNVGKWTYAVIFRRGPGAALAPKALAADLAPFHGQSGTFTILPNDKLAPDFRSGGRLSYVGKHYLQFAGSKDYFLKAGADAPETLLAYADFDNTEARKKNVPLKTWAPHVKDWRDGDPAWKGGKGKGLIGALNYLSGKGANAFSFLTYNAGGDGDNIWPFVARGEKLHYDCSKLDQWGVLFDHATSHGLYLHFKMQENEMDDDRRGHEAANGRVAESLDGGKLGPERRLYCRELIARFGHNLALNWNIGEENTQSTEEIRDMAAYLMATDPYDHPVVIHTFPGSQDKVYTPLLGGKSTLSGASLQNSWSQAHQRTLKWVTESAKAGKPWIVANDEQNPASDGVPADPGYEGKDGTATEGGKKYTLHDIRKRCLWGTLMAGGAGVEYYFGYKLPQNDLVCEDWRSRDKTWDYCRIAIDFFHDEKIPFWEMANADALVGNPSNDNSKYAFAKAGEIYLVFLPEGGTTELDLSAASGDFMVQWFNPRAGGALKEGSVNVVRGGGSVLLGNPPGEPDEDWLVVLRR